MAAEVRPIRTKRDYEAALEEVARLWRAKAGTRKGDRLDVLATLIDAYEAEHYPMDPPDPIEAIKFRMEQQGSHPEGPGAHHWNADPRGGSAQPQAVAVDRYDSAPA